MSEGAIRRDVIPKALLQIPKLREAALLLAIEEDLAVETNEKNAGVASRNEGDFGELRFEGRQQFLRGPTGTHQPSTADAILDLDPWPSDGRFGVG